MSDDPSKVQDAIELQRAAIAGEIHDSLIPYLFATKMRLEALVARLEESTAGHDVSDHGQAAQDETAAKSLVSTEVTKSIETLQAAMAIAGQLTAELYPPDLSETSWAEHLTASLARSGGTATTKLEIQGDFDAIVSALDLRIAGRRIAQEAIRNAVRHGHASSVVVTVQPRDLQQIELSICDNGRGFKGQLP